MKESNRFEPYCTTDSVILILRHATLSYPRSADAVRLPVHQGSSLSLISVPNFSRQSSRTGSLIN